MYNPFYKVALWVAMETMQIHITKVALVLRTVFLNLSCSIERIGIHKKMS